VHGRSPVWDPVRFRYLCGALALWGLVLAGRLCQFHLGSHTRYQSLADQQSKDVVPLAARRGAIFDRTGQELALSVESEAVTVDPRHIPDFDNSVAALSRCLDLDSAALKEALERARKARRGYYRVKRQISASQAACLRSLNETATYPWIRFEPDYWRVYPSGPAAAHVIGTVNYEGRGDGGLELSLDQVLAGQPGKAEVVRDAKGRDLAWEVLVPPRPGADIGLSIDARIQYKAHEELRRAAQQWNCPAGSVVVLDPETGDILAMASYPEFDPERPPRTAQEVSYRTNHAVATPFEPGSVFKIVTVSAALERGVVRPETVIDCGAGVIWLGGRRVRDIHAYGPLTVEQVLAKSSNIGAIKIAMRLGQEKLYQFVRRFGFGERTGVPFPAESRGRVYPLERWGKTSFASVAMGHEVMATSLQLAVAMATIANNGLRPAPRLILWQGQLGGGKQWEPVRPGQRVLSAETAVVMRKLAEQVVLAGTARAARLRGYSAGGKTGSAQIYDPVTGRYTHRYNASFVGFAPVGRPRIVVAVTLQGAPRYGGVVAAPVFREVAQYALQVLGVVPDVPVEPELPAPPEEELNDVALAELTGNVPAEPSERPVASPAGPPLVGPRVPDLIGAPLRAALAECARLNLPVRVVGHGRVHAQEPKPGQELVEGITLRLECRP